MGEPANRQTKSQAEGAGGPAGRHVITQAGRRGGKKSQASRKVGSTHASRQSGRQADSPTLGRYPKPVVSFFTVFPNCSSKISAGSSRVAIAATVALVLMQIEQHQSQVPPHISSSFLPFHLSSSQEH